MGSGAASKQFRGVALVLVAAILSLAPGIAQAQPSGGLEPMAASCDLPVLQVFNPSPGDMLQPGDYQISGVAIDPKAQQGSGIDQVSFYLGDRDNGGIALGTVTPSLGSHQADFSLTVTLPNMDPASEQQLVGFARSALTSKETELSLPIVLGKDPSHTSPTIADPAANTINTNPGVLSDACAPSPDAAAPVPNAAAPVPNAAAPVPNAAAPVPAPQATAATGTAATDASFGSVVGSVSECQDGAEQPVGAVRVRAQGTSSSAETDDSGNFSLMQVPAPATYTISVSDGGQTATRAFVPVVPGETIDIGTLVIGACGDDDGGP